ncbi:MAG TPA: M48 family metalloprotease [Terriglobales bacterium]|nr:M48 family metalloprotease [Terriglobales bacterium]
MVGGTRRAGWWALLLVLILSGAGGAAQTPAPAADIPATAGTAAPRDADQILDGMSAREQQLYRRMQELTPRVETYMQNLRTDPVLGDVPIADRYYLGILHYHRGFNTLSFLPEPQARWRQLIGPIDDLLTWPARRVLDLNLYRSSFAGMLFPGGDHFDRQHYRFAFVRTEFLGQVRCYVFDVVPLDVHAKGSFWGRIWIEDQDLVLVRFNGSFWQNRYGHPDLHFDSWRLNVRPGVWVPAYIYTEESDLGYGLFRHARFQAQTRLWGYDLHLAGRQQELTSITIEGTDLPSPPPKVLLSPLGSTRAWERQAEGNVLDRLERAGLLAPPGPADNVLQTVVNNLIITNHLTIDPAVRCRILLTTPLETFTVGHTIVISRGLIDSLPDEASLAAMLAHELAHIDLGQRLDTRYAFTDRMLFADQNSFRLLDLARSPQEEDAANRLAAQLLLHSPYKDKLASAGLFLRQVDARRQLSPNLFSPHLGNPWFSHDYLKRLHELEATAPALQPAQVSQIAALPLGGRIVVDPWDDAVSLQTPEAMPLLSARDKMPLQLTPFFPYLERAQPSVAVSSTASGAAPAAPPAANAGPGH